MKIFCSWKSRAGFAGFAILMLATCVAVTGCGRSHSQPLNAAVAKRTPSANPMVLVLAPYAGNGRTDVEIRRWQEQVRAGHHPEQALERLGWWFVAKARESFDSGFYKLAEQCALCLEMKSPRLPEALLLRGHVLHNLHRFQEAEVLARELVAVRALAFDYALLGDVLMEQGRLTEAVSAYQQMVDLKPDVQAYARIAHLRWLKGDLAGALELMQQAARSSSPHDAESSAWVYSRLALYQLQAGDVKTALDSCAAALSVSPDYAPALLVQGRILVAEGKTGEAIEPLRRSAALNPLPECQWILAETLRVAGRSDDAKLVESDLQQRGAVNDPRTFALFLATRGDQIPLAQRLAQQELEARADVLTHDALAWTLAAGGRLKDARAHMERALAEGTRDARLFFHAGMIATKLGLGDEAQRHFTEASALQQMLLPSEREQLAKQFAVWEARKEMPAAGHLPAAVPTTALSSLRMASERGQNQQ